MSSLILKPLVDVSEPSTLSEPQGSLYGILASNTGRYDRQSPTLEIPASIHIKAGLFTGRNYPEPGYLPQRWSEHTHPEGQQYFFKCASNQRSYRIVTELNILLPTNLELVQRWLLRIEKLLANVSIQITDQVELYILPWKGDCFYYFVDYTTRVLFLLEDDDTEELGINGVVSESHLKLALEDQFWTHVSHFPMHFGGLPKQVVDELTAVLCHALTDLSTSALSTYSYTHEQLRDYLKTLKISREQIQDGNQTCLVARLNHGIYQHRFLIHHGQEKARLSRDQTIRYALYAGDGAVDKFLSAVTFMASRYYHQRLNGVFVDRVTYTTSWREYAGETVGEMKDVSLMAFAGMMLHIFTFDSPNPTLSVISFGLCIISTASSLLLTSRYRSLQKRSSTSAHKYLSTIESTRSGFRWTSFVLGLPFALLIWALLVLYANLILVLAQNFGVQTAAICTALTALGLFWFQRQTDGSPMGFSDLIPHWLRREPREKSEEDIV